MPKFRSTESSLYNGISQQSPELRLDSQVTDCTNVNLTLARGLEMRPPGELVLSESGSYSSDSLVHSINDTSSSSFLVVIGGSDSTLPNKVYDTQGNTYPLVFQDSTAEDYLLATDSSGEFNPSRDLKLSSVLDATFVTNKNIIPAMSSTLLPSLPNNGYIWVKNGVQQVARTVNIDISSTTDPKDTVNDSSNVIDHFQANLPAGFSSTRASDSILQIYRNDDGPFTLKVTDTYADTTMSSSLTQGLILEDLPPVAENGEIMRIVADNSTDVDYYLKYNSDTTSWSEVSAPGESASFNSATMPHILLRKQDDGLGTITGVPLSIYFSFERISWVDRLSGDNETSPPPSFIGKPIQDIFFFKNRLGFIAGDAVILSATGDIYRFWPTTVKEVLDDDPIDTPVSSSRDVALQHVAQFPENLILVGDTEQFTLGSGGKSFTPENAVLDPTTSYPADPTVVPVSVGSTLYFVSPQSSYVSVREYSVQPDTLVTDAADITSHVPRLIENNVKSIISENSLEYLFLTNTEEYSADGNELLVYKFYWQGNEKVQSAWKRWKLWFNPVGGTTLNGRLYLIGTEKVGGLDSTVLVSFNLSDKPPIVLDVDQDTYKSPRPYIDRLSNIDAVPSPSGDLITLEVSVDQYNYPAVENATTVVVDRISGIKYSYVSRYIDSGKYYLVFSNPSFLVSGALEFDDTLLGSYILGGEALDAPDSFPYILPFILTS